jgi:hypothetical protein
MRFDCNEIGDIMSEIAAYGTAVTVEPVLSMTPGTIPEPHVSREQACLAQKEAQAGIQKPTASRCGHAE